MLERRLVDIYKRGQLYTFQVLLAAESFGDLLTRYKYLYLTSRQDRALVADVEKLAEPGPATARTRSRGADRSSTTRRRSARPSSSATAPWWRSAPRGCRRRERSAKNTEQRLTALERDEARLNDLLAALERARADSGRPRRRGGDRSRLAHHRRHRQARLAGRGTIVYRFGRETLPSGGVIRWNGIGIGAPAGTPVKAVEAGKVGLVQQPRHLRPDGRRSSTATATGRSTCSCSDAAVALGDRRWSKGQMIGTVGGANTDDGPHLHFEIRGENRIALDPADWLRKRR